MDGPDLGDQGGFGLVAAAAEGCLAAQAEKAEVDTPAAVHAAVTGNPAAF